MTGVFTSMACVLAGPLCDADLNDEASCRRYLNRHGYRVDHMTADTLALIRERAREERQKMRDLFTRQPRRAAA
jgi:hypothetical protein